MADIQVFTVDPDNKTLEFDLALDQYIGGLSFLMQWSIKLLLDSTSEPLAPTQAGNLQDMIGMAITRDEKRAMIAESLNRVEEFMKESQRGQETPPPRQLKEIELMEVTANDTQTKIRYRVRNTEGSSADIGLPLGR